MRHSLIGRRGFIRVSSLASCFALYGCKFTPNTPIDNPTLTSYEGILPESIISNLPLSWRFKLLRYKRQENPYMTLAQENFDFLAIGDGWLQELSIDSFASFGDHELFDNLNIKAKEFLKNFDSQISKKILPIGYSPWVMLFRNGEKLLPEAKETWKVLLKKELKDQLVLPNSSRVVMALADKIEGKDVLRDLRGQAKTFDDRNALNWVISGKAKAAVMPLQNCITSVLRDPRLNVVIPLEGAPLNWTLLLKSGASQFSVPSSLITTTFKRPLLTKLLLDGWIPPIDFSKVINIVKLLPEQSKSIYGLSQESYKNFWSLEPLTDLNQSTLESRWNSSLP